MASQPKVLVIVGPTASGKTSLARRMALKYNGEIISADSRQVYRGLDIGAGKEGQLRPNISSPALADRFPMLRYLEDITQWLIDVADPASTNYTVADFQHDCLLVIEDILSRGKLPIICGGTGLYVSAVLDGYDFSVKVERSHDNPRHSAGSTYKKSPPNWDSLMLLVEPEREQLYKQIDDRVDQRIEQGMIEEVKNLLQTTPAERLMSFGLEYRFITEYLQKNQDQTEMIQRLKFAIHQFARRQLTWWRHHGEPLKFSDQQQTENSINSWLNR